MLNIKHVFYLVITIGANYISTPGQSGFCFGSKRWPGIVNSYVVTEMSRHYCFHLSHCYSYLALNCVFLLVSSQWSWHGKQDEFVIKKFNTWYWPTDTLKGFCHCLLDIVSVNRHRASQSIIFSVRRRDHQRQSSSVIVAIISVNRLQSSLQSSVSVVVVSRSRLWASLPIH